MLREVFEVGQSTSPSLLQREEVYPMAIAPGYEYDLFVSYAQPDDVDADNGDGWVTQVVRHLEAALCQRLGRSDTLAIFFDRRATGANYQLSDLLKAVERSALFLAIGSPSYIARDWPRQEFQKFLERTPDPSRLFLVEYLPLSDGETYPRPLDSYARLAFWKLGGTRHIPLPCSPAVDAAEFQPLIHSLAADIRAKLLSVKVLAAPTRSEGRGAVADSRKVVAIAQATDDLETEADQLRRYLQQYENEIEVLPRACYPQGGEAFRISFGNDLAHAAIFIQLLGPRAGRVPPDLSEGYTRYQYDTAKASGIKMLQWRHPDLDLASVTDPAHAAMLGAETVIACGFETFKRQIVEWARKPGPRTNLLRSSSVFINADRTDLEVAREIERECLREALTTILPLSNPSSEANRKDLTENLTECDVLLFVYGNTTQEWIRSQLRFFNKVKARRDTEPKLLAICSGPPPEKPDIGMSFPNAVQIQCPEGWNMEQIRALLREVAK